MLTHNLRIPSHHGFNDGPQNRVRLSEGMLLAGVVRMMMITRRFGTGTQFQNIKRTEREMTQEALRCRRTLKIT